jgi:hypothetical protein
MRYDEGVMSDAPIALDRITFQDLFNPQQHWMNDNHPLPLLYSSSLPFSTGWNIVRTIMPSLHLLYSL